MSTNSMKTEETRRALVQSAIEIISKKGYAKTTLEDIVQNIGMTRGAFYWHFKNKKEILNEIETLYENQYLRDYGKFEVLPSAYKTLENVVRHQIRGIFEDEHMTYAFIMRYRVEALTELPDFVEKQVKIDDFSICRLEEQVERGIRQGEFRSDVNPHEAALAIFTYIVGVEYVKMLHQENDEVYRYEYFVDAGLKFLLKILT